VAIRADDVDLARDRLLVEAWQAGDASAFDELYRTYFDRLRAYCERRVGSAAAEEVAQDTFLKALRALPTFSGDRRFYPWLTVIAHRLCIDHVRRLGRIQPRDDIELGSVDDGHDARLDLQADLANLDRALGRLTPRHAEVLDLRERRELTYEQIAGQLGVPHSTVETLLFRARKALRREFHAVAGERLAAIPGIGWVLVRAGRLRARLAAVGPDVGTIGGALAAGAATAALAVLPGVAPVPAAPAPRPVALAESPAAAVLVTLPQAPAPTAPALRPAATASTPPPPERRHVVRPTTAAEAKGEARTMPIQVDLDQTGVGIDLMPVLDRLGLTPSGSNPP
jgi:RNA polymerase sigma-70 factor (ECF subfamily)